MKLILIALMSFSFFSHAKTEKSMDVDLSKSVVKWHAKKVIGNSSHHGIIPIEKANVKLDNKGNVANAMFVMNMKKFEAKDLSGEKKAKFEGHLKSADFFNVEKEGHDKAELNIDSVKGNMAKGKLTFNKVTKPITLEFKKSGNTYSGTYTLNRTDYNVKYGSNSFFKGLGDKAIADEVKIDFTLVASAKSKSK